MITDMALLRLLQLVSPSLPIGMYSYSQGFEGAVEDGLVGSADDARAWLQGLLLTGVLHTDLPILQRCHGAWASGDVAAVQGWSAELMAWRETAELRAEDRQLGQALARLLGEQGIAHARPWQRRADTTLAAVFALATVEWEVPLRPALTGYAWSWLENQVLCAVKIVPLGQVAGQRLLGDLAALLPGIIERAMSLADAELGGSAFGLGLVSSRHEQQYSRLFRS